MAASSALVRQAVRYLSEQNTTLWGRAFDINSDDGRALAAEWFAEQFTDFAKFMDRDPLAGLKVPNFVTGAAPPRLIQAWNNPGPPNVYGRSPDGKVPYA